MLAPYANSTDSGTPAMDADEFNKLVRLLDARGWQVMTHAVGDRAVNMALTAYEHAVRSNPLPDRGRRHRIEHADTVDAYDLPRFGALGVIASMQPYTGNPTPARIELWSKNVGAERSSRAWPYHSISAGAGRLAFGSDWPSAPLNPMVGLHTAVTRTTILTDCPRAAGTRASARAEGRDRRLHVWRRVGLIRRAAQGHAGRRHAR